MNNFQKNEILGREAFEQLLKERNSNIELSFTEDCFSPYDAYFKQYSEKEKKMKHYFVELKIRNAIYDSYILERKKLINMRRAAVKDLNLNLEDCVFFYVNFTPVNTVLWNITKVDKFLAAEQGTFNKATAISHKEKKRKLVFYLPVNEGLVYDYIIKK